MYRKPSLPFLTIALAGLLIAGAGPAMAQGISGTFAFTASGSCIEVDAPATFNSSFQPTAGPVFFDSFNSLGYRVFNTDGTGSQVTLLGVSTFVPVPPGTTFTPASSSASSWKIQSQFTYTMSGGIVTITLTPNSYLQTFLSGPRAGQTATQDVLGAYGFISPDGKTLITISKSTEVETKTFSNNDVRKSVCNRSSQGFLVP
jgi:hypothetical protein